MLDLLTHQDLLRNPQFPTVGSLPGAAGEDMAEDGAFRDTMSSTFEDLARPLGERTLPKPNPERLDAALAEDVRTLSLDAIPVAADTTGKPLPRVGNPAPAHPAHAPGNLALAPAASTHAPADSPQAHVAIAVAQTNQARSIETDLAPIRAQDATGTRPTLDPDPVSETLHRRPLEVRPTPHAERAAHGIRPDARLINEQALAAPQRVDSGLSHAQRAVPTTMTPETAKPSTVHTEGVQKPSAEAPHQLQRRAVRFTSAPIESTVQAKPLEPMSTKPVDQPLPQHMHPVKPDVQTATDPHKRQASARVVVPAAVNLDESADESRPATLPPSPRLPVNPELPMQRAGQGRPEMTGLNATVAPPVVQTADWRTELQTVARAPIGPSPDSYENVPVGQPRIDADTATVLQKSPSVTTPAPVAADENSANRPIHEVTRPTQSFELAALTKNAVAQADEVNEQLLRFTLRNAARSGQLTLQLQPRELGKLELEFSAEKTDLNIAIVARESSTREILEASLPRLKSMLTDAGINLGQLDVRQHEERERGPAERPRLADQGDTGQDDAPLTDRASNGHDGMLDLYV